MPIYSPDRDWWRHFFESPDAFELGMFPDEAETDIEVAGLVSMLDLRARERVADICCGAGRHLVRLAARGLCMVGFDLSEMMLDLSREAIADAGVRAPLVRGDMRRLPFRSGSFDVVLNLFNSFGYLPTDRDDEQALQEMARLLRPGGRLLLDTRNRQFQILFAPYRMEVTLPDGRPAFVGSTYDRQGKRLDTVWRDAADEQMVHYRASIRLYGLEELDEMMSRVGLERTALYGDYEGAEFEGYQRQLLYVARKA
jgi:SAM-dependent methyltransferase